jgi:hypothetical protein
MTTDKSIQLILFEQIVTALAALKTSGDIKGIEIYNNQVDAEGASRGRAYTYPFVAVEMGTDWSGNKVTSDSFILQSPQQGTCTVVIHVIDQFKDYETETFVRVETVRQKVFRALNMLAYTYTEGGVKYAAFTPLIRVRSNVDHDHDNMIDFTTEFRTELTEAGLRAATSTVAVTDIELTKQIDIDNDNIRTGDGDFT